MDSNDDFVSLEIGSQSMIVSKQLISSKSPYFERLISSGEQHLKVVITESEINSLKILLNIALNVHSNDDLILWFRTKETVFQLIQTSHKYQFQDIFEEMSSEFVDSFEQILDFSHFSEVMCFYKRSLKTGINRLSDCCLQVLDKNADKVMEILDKDFVLTNFRPQILRDILSRDTFGVHEMKIYYLIQRWTHILGQFNEALIQTIRFTKLDKIYVKFGLFSPKPFDRTFLRYVLSLNQNSEQLVQKSRVCRQPEVRLAINAVDTESIKVSPDMFDNNQDVVKRYVFSLPIETHINYLRFSLPKRRISSDLPIVHYIVEVCVKNQWLQVWNCQKTPCFSKQELYFNEVIASAIRITGITVNDFSFSLTYLDNNLMNYGLSANRVETKDFSLVPGIDYLCSSNAVCLLLFTKVNQTFDITEYALKGRLYSQFIFNVLNRLKTNRFGVSVTYLLRFTQPLFVNCIEIELKSNSQQTNTFTISASLAFISHKCEEKWDLIEVNNEFINNFKTISFEAKHISCVKIVGYRSPQLLKGFQRLPLHIKKFNIYYKKP